MAEKDQRPLSELDELLKAMADETPEMPADFHEKWKQAVLKESGADREPMPARQGKTQWKRLAGIAAVMLLLLGGVIAARDSFVMKSPNMAAPAATEPAAAAANAAVRERRTAESKPGEDPDGGLQAAMTAAPTPVPTATPAATETAMPTAPATAMPAPPRMGDEPAGVVFAAGSAAKVAEEPLGDGALEGPAGEPAEEEFAAGFAAEDADEPLEDGALEGPAGEPAEAEAAAGFSSVEAESAVKDEAVEDVAEDSGEARPEADEPAGPDRQLTALLTVIAGAAVLTVLLTVR